MGWSMVFAGFSNGLCKVVVNGRGRCEDLRCLVVGADYREFAIVACPESEQREDNGRVRHLIFVCIEKNGGDFLVSLLFAYGQDGVFDVQGLLEGEMTDLRELLIVVRGAGKVQQVEVAWDAGVWRS